MGTSVRFLLDNGLDAVGGLPAETRDFQGKLAVDHIASRVPDDKRNGSMEAAVRRILRKGPAFRARSWTWPGAVNATLGGASKVPPSSSTPVLKTRMHAGGQMLKSAGNTRWTSAVASTGMFGRSISHSLDIRDTTTSPT
ncbi:unnamed protein product [Ectocarpus sp. 8 AP-2014]